MAGPGYAGHAAFLARQRMPAMRAEQARQEAKSCQALQRAREALTRWQITTKMKGCGR